ncbi:MAG: hypothetical protein II849_10860 [Bacteroidales bacterium]|nr:hypothetical protein [Bacteroidales bacterium]MBR0201842.1 hypothetical protein [Bacteroidaceae bacterium]
MNKKAYQKPQMQVVKIQQIHIICTSDVHTFSTNLTGDDAINYGGGNTGPARSRSNGEWDEWDD